MAKKNLSPVGELIEEAEKLLAESETVKKDLKLQKGLSKLVEACYLIDEDLDGDDEE